MQQIFTETVGSDLIDFTARVTESVLARLHFVIRMPRGEEVPELDFEQLEADLVEAARVWEDDVADVLKARVRRRQGGRAAAPLRRGVPRGVQGGLRRRDRGRRTCGGSTRSATTASTCTSTSRRTATEREPRFKIFRRGDADLAVARCCRCCSTWASRSSTSARTRSTRPDGSADWIYDFGLRYRGREPIDPTDADDLQRRFQEAFNAAWRGQAESDGFNALVITAGHHLAPRRRCCGRTRSTSARSGTTFSQDYIEECLNAHVPITRAAGRPLPAPGSTPTPTGDRDVDGRRDPRQDVLDGARRASPASTRTGSCGRTSR